jgi:hypothetical protein
MATAGAAIVSSTMAEDAITVEAAPQPVAPMQMADAEVMQAAKAMQAMTMQATQRQFVPIEVARRAPAAIPAPEPRGQAQPMQPHMLHRTRRRNMLPQRMAVVALRMVGKLTAAVDRTVVAANTTSL